MGAYCATCPLRRRNMPCIAQEPDCEHACSLLAGKGAAWSILTESSRLRNSTAAGRAAFAADWLTRFPAPAPRSPRLATRRRPDAPQLEPNIWIDTARLAADAQAFAARLPTDVDLVIGIARSGLVPAAVWAFGLHVPLGSVHRREGLHLLGGGHRLEDGRTGKPFTPKHVLLADDTVYYGRQMREHLPIVRKAFPAARITRAVVYADPMGLAAIDLCAFVSPSHFLEWHVFNSPYSRLCGYDFDGVLCRDFTGAECATAESYEAALATIEPKYLPRSGPIPLIVTMRPESIRALTEAWLARHGIAVERLVMRDWEVDPTNPGAAPSTEVAARFKASHYAASACNLFVESDPAQAKLIARYANRRVLCPAAGRLIPAPHPERTVQPRAQRTVNGAERDALAIVGRCPHAKLPACTCAGKIACGPAGTHPNEVVALAVCHACLASTA